MPATFINGELKTHRQNTLFDMERALLPGTMPVVRAHLYARTLSNTNRQLQGRINELMAQMRTLSGTIHGNQVLIEHIDRALYMERMIPEFAEDWVPNEQPTHQPSAAGVFKSTIMCPCPAPDCRGFVKSVEEGAPKCGVCSAAICKTCHEWTREADTGSEEAPVHVCKPDDIKSAEAIRKSTRPCPQCAVPIFRISGCSQMFCVSCKTAFDWNTGDILNRRAIHNPHYYEWIQSQRASATTSATPPNDTTAANACDAPVDIMALSQWCSYALPFGANRMHEEQYETNNNILQFHRILSHIEDVEIGQLRPQAQVGENNNMLLRTRYLNNQIDEEEFKRLIVVKEIGRAKSHDVMQVFEMMVEAGRDIYRNYVRRGMRSAAQAHLLIAELMELLRYSNECFIGVSRNYNNTSVPHVGRYDGHNNGRWYGYRVRTQRSGAVRREALHVIDEDA